MSLRNIVTAISLILVGLLLAPASENLAQVPDHPDLSQCDNCDDFPDAWLHVDPEELLDLAALPPERRLDFLIGEWELLFPYEDEEKGFHFSREQPIGYDIFRWFVPDGVIEGFQEWPFTSKGHWPFRARTDFRYVKPEDRWQMTWITGTSAGFYTGGLEDSGVFALYEHEPVGDRHKLSLSPGMRYVFRNITGNRFLAEEWNSADGGKTYTTLNWRLLYRRRLP